MSESHWHILGAGAIGCLFANALAKHNNAVTLVMRESDDLNARTVVVEHSNERNTQQLDIITPDSNQRISHLLVTTKAYDVRTAIAGITHLLDDRSVVVLLVNGMGFAEQITQDWPHLNIFCGSTTEGAYRIAQQHIAHAGHGVTRIGRDGMPAPDWFKHWQRAIHNCTWDPHIATALWSKLAINCVVNPLTALHGCRNGALANDKLLAQETRALSQEVADIIAAAGYPSIAAALPQNIAKVIAATAHNQSSMLQDVQKQRQTEIDYINGYLVAVAARYHIAAPLNRELLHRIKRL